MPAEASIAVPPTPPKSSPEAATAEPTPALVVVAIVAAIHDSHLRPHGLPKHSNGASHPRRLGGRRCRLRGASHSVRIGGHRRRLRGAWSYCLQESGKQRRLAFSRGKRLWSRGKRLWLWGLLGREAAERVFLGFLQDDLQLLMIGPPLLPHDPHLVLLAAHLLPQFEVFRWRLRVVFIVPDTNEVSQCFGCHRRLAFLHQLAQLTNLFSQVVNLALDFLVLGLKFDELDKLFLGSVLRLHLHARRHRLLHHRLPLRGIGPRGRRR
mmetsp:Transcript_121504/g.389059  ORF Transcript_121504/g.389059 Transcript_121504/m.389059 type:complete len:266 (+) Transcript_121504:625-1422(+)